MTQPPLRIGIPARIQHPGNEDGGCHCHSYHFLEQTLAHWVMSKGAMLFMIPSLCEECLSGGQALSDYDYSDFLDGLILQGGPDIAPELYGAVPNSSNSVGDIPHDSHQIRLIKQFLVTQKPILGICRGAQLINVALGGTLHQDIPTHGMPTRKPVIHEVFWEPDSSLARLYPGKASGLVMSVHHQAINRLGAGVKVEARSAKDGVIEAIRLEGRPYVAGLQWHPECHVSNNDLLDCNPVLDEFLSKAKERRDDFGKALRQLY